MGISTAEFDVSRAILHDRDAFPPFDVATTRPLHESLAQDQVSADTPVQVFELHGQALAFLVQQLSWHHVARGQTNGEPWLVTF